MEIGCGLVKFNLPERVRQMSAGPGIQDSKKTPRTEEAAARSNFYFYYNV
jgi:hypothetical protein